MPLRTPVRSRVVPGVLGVAVIAISLLLILEFDWTPDESYSNSVEKSSPRVWLRFDELKGSTAHNSAPDQSPIEGRYVGSVGLGVEGSSSNKIDTAITLNGSSYVRLTDRLDFIQRKPFSIEIWAKPSSPQPSPYTRLVSEERFEGSDRYGWSLYFDDAQKIVGFERRSGHRAQSALTHYRLADDQYTYIVGTFDGTTAKLYIDGRKVSESGSRSVPRLSSIAEPVTIGRLRRPATAYFLGSLDEMVVYERALRPAEIDAHWMAAR